MKSQTMLPVAPPSGGPGMESVPQLIAATAHTLPEQRHALERARSFAEPLIGGECLDSGENTLAHADAVATILKSIGGSEAMQAASYLVHACEHLNKPQEVIAKAFGDNFATLAVETTQLMRVQYQTRMAQAAGQQVDDVAAQTETVRKMLLAFSRDLRVVMLRLASRLQTLRYYAASKKPVPPALARESLHVFAPLANRLGIWQIKWEMEDLSFRFLEPDTYREVARLLDEKRTEREVNMAQLRERVESQLRAQSISATVTGRPKHIYSIVKKMRGKSLNFDQVFDVRALRVIVPSVKDCYSALSWVHSRFTPLVEEFDDYIAKPKPNGYQSLHTIVRDDSGRPVEIQIRTQAMHDHAEHGVAAHWAYKEAGSKGYAGVTAGGDYDSKIAVLRQLLAWERDLAGAPQHAGLFDDRIYVLTPNAAIVELPKGSTPVDFAYTVHTSVATAAVVRASTAPWFRSTPRCKTARRWKSPRPRKAAPRATGSTPSWATWAATVRVPRCVPGSMRSNSTKPLRAAARQWKNSCSAKARPPCAWKTWPASSASSRPMRCSRWWARTSSRCATSKTCCVRPSPRCRPTTSCCSRSRAMPAAPPRAGFWWWASNRS